MILTHEHIIKQLALGNLVCIPSDPSLISINSIDVRLGDKMWEMVEKEYRDIYTEDGTEWRQMTPLPAKVIRTRWPKWGKSIPDETLCFVLQSGKFYLGITLEKIGTKNPNKKFSAQSLPSYTTYIPKMMAKSSTGRHGLTTALCAGLGDVGYASPWALEIRNVNCGAVPMAVGTIMGQVVFEEGYPTFETYDGADRYQDKGEVRFLPKPMKVLAE